MYSGKIFIFVTESPKAKILPTEIHYDDVLRAHNENNTPKIFFQGLKINPSRYTVFEKQQFFRPNTACSNITSLLSLPSVGWSAVPAGSVTVCTVVR